MPIMLISTFIGREHVANAGVLFKGLFIWKANREQKRGREYERTLSNCHFTFWMSASVSYQEPETTHVYHMSADPKGSSFATFPGTLVGKWIRSREPVHDLALLWDVASKAAAWPNLLQCWLSLGILLCVYMDWYLSPGRPHHMQCGN